MEPISIGVLTISDRCFEGEAVDESGSAIVEDIQNGRIKNATVTKTDLVPDDVGLIRERILSWCDDLRMNVILTTGGTGLSPRDVTPEAIAPLLDKTVSGITNLIFKRSSDITHLAALSRGIAGVRGTSLIVTFPGSKKASLECLGIVAGIIPHAVDVITDKKRSITQLHASFDGKSKVDGRNVASRSRQSTYPLLSVQKAQELIKTHVGVNGVKLTTLNEALNCVLAEDVHANDPLPPFRASIKDGYAVVSSDAAEIKQVIGASSAGDALAESFVTPGRCVRINTGARVPSGADAVVQVEDTYLVEGADEESKVGFKTKAKPGQDIRLPGSDINAGELVLKKGAVLGPCELGVLAAVGIIRFNVIAKPRIGVLSTGNELLDPEDMLQPGKIRDSNRTTLLNLLKQDDCCGIDLGIAKDEPDCLYRALRKGFRDADIIITTGSVSMGEKDYLKQVLVTDFDAEIHFGRVNMKPGKPTTFGSLFVNDRKKFWFGLPGNPASAAVTYQLFVLPAVKILSGWKEPFLTRIKARLDEDVTLDERPEFRRAILKYGNDEVPLASTTGNQISSRLLSCVGANCLLELPSSLEQRVIKKNAIVNALLIQKP